MKHVPPSDVRTAEGPETAHNATAAAIAPDVMGAETVKNAMEQRTVPTARDPVDVLIVTVRERRAGSPDVKYAAAAGTVRDVKDMERVLFAKELGTVNCVVETRTVRRVKEAVCATIVVVTA